MTNKISRGRVILGLMLAVGLAGCVQVVPTPTETPAVVVTQEPTATVEWFPATETATLAPTAVYTPTPDLRPGQGELLLDEDFEEEGGWSALDGFLGSATYGDMQLTMVLSEGLGFFYMGLDNTVLGDFYMEVTASVNLCRGADEYGLLVRVTPEGQYYRYSLSCDGRARVDRFYQGQIATLAPWTVNGAIPRTVPSSVRLGVWVRGEEMRFFVDDQYLFSVRDTLFYQGGVGVFVRRTGETPVTVSYSEMKVWGLDG